MMSNRRFLLCAVLAALTAAVCACQAAVPDGPYSEPEGVDSPAVISLEEPEETASIEEKEPSSGEEEASSASSQNLSDASQQQAESLASPQGEKGPESEPSVAVLPPSSSSSQSASSRPSSSLAVAELPASADSEEGREGTELIKGKAVSLLQWQWVDKDRLALITYYSDTDETRMLLYNRKNMVIKTLARFNGKPESVEAPFYEEQIEFLLDNYSLSMGREDQQPDIGAPWDDNDLLPKADEDYGYWGVSFSSSRKYLFYERFPTKYQAGSLSASDRIYIDNVLSAFEYDPCGEIAFPFDVRVTPKRALWLNWNDRILVEADIPQKEQYDRYRRTYYVYTASGQEVTHFSVENGLSLCDTYRNLLLFERAGEPYELICYDYISKKSRSVMTLEGENRPFSAVRFSPDGKEIAVLRPGTDLTPQFYPVPEID